MAKKVLPLIAAIALLGVIVVLAHRSIVNRNLGANNNSELHIDSNSEVQRQKRPLAHNRDDVIQGTSQEINSHVKVADKSEEIHQPDTIDLEELSKFVIKANEEGRLGNIWADTAKKIADVISRNPANIKKLRNLLFTCSLEPSLQEEDSLKLITVDALEMSGLFEARSVLREMFSGSDRSVEIRERSFAKLMEKPLSAEEKNELILVASVMINDPRAHLDLRAAVLQQLRNYFEVPVVKAAVDKIMLDPLQTTPDMVHAALTNFYGQYDGQIVVSVLQKAASEETKGRWFGYARLASFLLEKEPELAKAPVMQNLNDKNLADATFHSLQRAYTSTSGVDTTRLDRLFRNEELLGIMAEKLQNQSDSKTQMAIVRIAHCLNEIFIRGRSDSLQSIAKPILNQYIETYKNKYGSFPPGFSTGF